METPAGWHSSGSFSWAFRIPGPATDLLDGEWIPKSKVFSLLGDSTSRTALFQSSITPASLWEGIVTLPRPPPPPFDIETMEQIEPPWQAIKEWIFPTTNRTSTGSTVLRIRPILTPSASIKARLGIHPKSDWTTTALWFSKISDSAQRTAKKPLPKTILARRIGKLRSRQMNFPPKSSSLPTPRHPAAHCSVQHFSFPALPPPCNSLFPDLRSGPTAVSGTSRKQQIPSSSVDKPSGANLHAPGSSMKPSSFRMRVGWRILRRALASIWRMRSRVTWNWRPTSSSVRL